MTNRDAAQVCEVRRVVEAACNAVVEASSVVWVELDADERAMLVRICTQREWSIPSDLHALRTFLRLDQLGLVSAAEISGEASGVAPTVFAAAMVEVCHRG